MLVTEGAASKKDRLVCLTIGIALLVFAVLTCTALPHLSAPILWVGLFLSAGFVARNVVLSVIARSSAGETVGEPVSLPSVALILPCLNELPSLRQTVPAMMNLHHEGRILFCYVCEHASTDGSIEYLWACTRADPRIVVVKKTSAPAGRGAAVAYGLAHGPRCDIVGFLDADHVLDQESLEELIRTLGQRNPPVAVQGRCAMLNGSPNLLARLLDIERRWLELAELKANPRLGGMCQFGGGQGFFIRSLFDDTRLQIDDSMLLDDADLSCRLALNGCRVIFNPRIATKSLQPESPAEFMDQRVRWARGWVQLAAKYLPSPLRCWKAPLALRLDVLRLVLTPLVGAWLWLSFVGGATALLLREGSHVPAWLASVCLLWPLLLGAGPFLAGIRPARLRDVPLTVIGIPLLIYLYCWIVTVSITDMYVLRRPLGYAKTRK